jgi:predicted AAA+ superfamily ATPase
LLQTSCLIYLLPPWHTHTRKRLVKTPKLYFYDTGLVCWLLGLREAQQVQRDPLWGSLFENMVVIEALKDRLNQGESTEMYFYRDSDGHEVDLLLPHARRLRAIEIKAGATVNPDYFKGLKKFAALYPSACDGGCVIYGGQENQSRSDWPVFSWKTLARRP